MVAHIEPDVKPGIEADVSEQELGTARDVHRREQATGRAVTAAPDGAAKTDGWTMRFHIVRDPNFTDEQREELLRSYQPRQRTQPPLSPGYVYLIRFENGIYKIGCTTNPTQRFKSLRCKFGPFDVLHLIATDRHEDAEFILHQRYRQKRVTNERFVLTPDDVADIQAIERM